MDNERDEFGRDEVNDAVYAHRRPAWLVWLAVPLIIIVFGVINFFMAKTEVRESKIRTRHILIKCDHNDLASSSVALERIQKIKEQLDAGADFRQLAEQYSEDPISAQNGGDIGFMTREELVEEYADAAFELQKNERSGIVKTGFGYHIIEVIDRIDPPSSAE